MDKCDYCVYGTTKSESVCNVAQCVQAKQIMEDEKMINDEARLEILEEMRGIYNPSLIEVVEEICNLNEMLVYLWQNKSGHINKEATPRILEEFNKLFINGVKRRLYRGFQIQSDCYLTREALLKSIELYVKSNKYLSFSNVLSVARKFMYSKDVKDLVTYNVLISIDTSYYIDINSIRNIGEFEYVLNSSDVAYNYSIEKVTMTKDFDLEG